MAGMIQEPVLSKAAERSSGAISYSVYAYSLMAGEVLCPGGTRRFMVNH